MQSTSTPTSTPTTLIRRPEVQARTGLPCASLYAMMKRNQFPRPVKITARAVAWTEASVDSWIESRLSAGSTAP